MWLRNIYLIAQPPLLAVMRGGESPLQKYTSKMYRALPLPLHAPLSDLLNRILDPSAFEEGLLRRIKKNVVLPQSAAQRGRSNSCLSSNICLTSPAAPRLR